MWRGIKLLSFWHRDQVRDARFQSSAGFRTDKTVSSHCVTALEVLHISAEPGCAMKSREVGMARTTTRSEQHNLGAQLLHPYPRETHMAWTLSLLQKTLKWDVSLLNVQIYDGFTGIPAHTPV